MKDEILYAKFVAKAIYHIQLYIHIINKSIIQIIVQAGVEADQKNYLLKEILIKMYTIPKIKLFFQKKKEQGKQTQRQK